MDYTGDGAANSLPERRNRRKEHRLQKGRASHHRHAGERHYAEFRGREAVWGMELRRSGLLGRQLHSPAQRQGEHGAGESTLRRGGSVAAPFARGKLNLIPNGGRGFLQKAGAAPPRDFGGGFLRKTPPRGRRAGGYFP